MNEVDELLGTENNQKDYHQSNKEKWEKQNRQRNEAYKKMDDMSLKIVKDGTVFQQYLDIMSKFEKYSVGNCLLILEANPNAIQIKEKQDWIDRGYSLVDNANKIIILEPNKVGERVYYNPKEEYDISQTNAPAFEKRNFTIREMMLAMVDICKKENIERGIVDVLPNGNKGSEYVEKEKRLYMCKGLKQEYLFKTVAQEIARMQMKVLEHSEMNEFKTFCISYMICKKYGLDTAQFDFSNLPKDLVNKSKGKEIREELEDIRVNFAEINDKISEYFEKEQKEKKNKEQER